MTEKELFDYLCENLYLDYDRGYSGGNSLDISLKLRRPKSEGNDMTYDANLGSVWIEIPENQNSSNYY